MTGGSAAGIAVLQEERENTVDRDLGRFPRFNKVSKFFHGEPRSFPMEHPMTV